MWYNKVTSNLSNIPAFIEYYSDELSNAKKEVFVHGHVETNIKELPGVTEQRFYQLQEIEAVLEFLNIELEAYQRSLSSRDAEKYVDGEDEVIDFELLINEVALLRNRWLGIMKGLDSKQWQLGHIVKLRTAGMEDVVV